MHLGINQGIAVFFISIIQIFSKINKRIPTFIPDSRVSPAVGYFCGTVHIHTYAYILTFHGLFEDSDSISSYALASFVISFIQK